MFGLKRRVDEDLERMRQANRTEEQQEDDRQRAEREKEQRAALGKVGWKDILAMIIAVFSILLPYILAFIGLMLAMTFAMAWIGAR